MPRALVSFTSLYAATLLMLLGSGLLSTYLALRLSANEVADIWIGSLMAANYLGLVIGGKLGHKLIARVGHVRAYVACGGLVTAAVLLHGLIDNLGAWFVLRLLVGLCMMCQYMVIESWLNEQADSQQRGMVFSGYMAAVYLGLVLGQLALGLESGLGIEVLLWVAICFALALVPVAVTRRMHPAPLVPAPLEPLFFVKRIPQSLITVAVSGLVTGAFYGLGPVYASAAGLDTAQVGQFMGVCILAGLVAQWPLGKLSDRIDRARLIRYNALLLLLACVPLLLIKEPGFLLLLLMAFAIGLLQFTLYPLAVALANDHVEAERRVSLTAMLLVTFALGACAGPLLVGGLMAFFGNSTLYGFSLVCAALLALLIRPQAVTGEHQVAEAPLQHQGMPPLIGSSPLVAALDPRVDEAVVQEQMVDQQPPAS